MSLPATITLNVGSPAADVVYSDPRRVGNAIVYTAPSPQGDLAGALSLRFSSERTKGGIERTLVQFVTPLYNSTDKVYVGTRTTDLVVKRPVGASVAGSEAEIEKIQELSSIVRTAIAAAQI